MAYPDLNKLRQKHLVESIEYRVVALEKQVRLLMESIRVLKMKV